MPTLWKHPNGKYYALYRENGAARRVSLKTRKKAAADVKFKEFCRKLEGGEAPLSRPMDPAPADFWEKYVEWMKQNVRQSTQDSRCWAWNHFLAHYTATRLSSVSEGSIERHKKIMKRTWKASTWNDFRRAMATIYADARQITFEDDMLPMYSGPNPWKNVRGLREDRVKKRVLTVEERDRLLDEARKHAAHCKADRIDLMIALMVLAGFRKGEAIACRWNWFDWDRKVVDLYEEAGAGGLKTVGTVPLCDKLIEILGKPGGDGYLYRPDVTEIRDGKRYRVNFRKSFNHVCELAGLTWVTPHLLRHTFGSLLLDAGVPLHKVSKWMRHSGIGVTSDIYYHNQPYDDEINRM